MKKLVKLISVPLLALSLQAGDWNTQSLIGIEGGAASFDLENNMGFADNSQSPGSFGLKIGAEGQSYRIFLGGRYYSVSDEFDYANSFGVEMQYLIRFNSNANIFAGLNGGVMNMEFSDSQNRTREVSRGYFGGDLGVNFTLSHNFDIELGVRYMNLNIENTKYEDDDTVNTYSIDNMTNAYVSLIYKFKI
ncbi:MAG: outer membrane beta-barrel protein [Campylobacterota bacterium]|nr:outer membrane beta-barrel protein [Campylobacterota bacterium]